MSGNRMQPVPITVTAIVELTDRESNADAVSIVKELLDEIQHHIAAAAEECKTPGRCLWHRVRLVVGAVGLKEIRAN